MFALNVFAHPHCVRAGLQRRPCRERKAVHRHVVADGENGFDNLPGSEVAGAALEHLIRHIPAFNHLLPKAQKGLPRLIYRGRGKIKLLDSLNHRRSGSKPREQKSTSLNPSHHYAPRIPLSATTTKKIPPKN